MLLRLLQWFKREPSNISLRGPPKPVAQEVFTRTLVVTGTIPPELNGLYVRTGANPQVMPSGAYHACASPHAALLRCFTAHARGVQHFNIADVSALRALTTARAGPTLVKFTMAAQNMSESSTHDPRLSFHVYHRRMQLRWGSHAARGLLLRRQSNGVPQSLAAHPALVRGARAQSGSVPPGALLSGRPCMLP